MGSPTMPASGGRGQPNGGQKEAEAEEEGSRFWRKMSQTGEVDADDKRADDLGNGDEEKAEPLRKVLQKKRSSLSHKPDIVRMFEKESDKAQQAPHVPEFFKVMRELKRVEGQSFDIRAAAQQEEYSMGNEQASEEPSNQNPSEADALEATGEMEEKRKASVGGKKRGVNAGKAVGPATKSVKPEQKKLADKVGDVKRANSVKVKPVKTSGPDPAAVKNSVSKEKQTLKKAMSVTTPKAKAEVGRTKSLGVKEKKVAPPTAPKPSKTVNKEDDASNVVADSKTVTETKSLPGHQKSGSQPMSAAKSNTAGKPIAPKAGAATKSNAPVTKEKKGSQVGVSVGPKKEVSEKKDTAGKKRPTAEKAKEAVPLRSKPALAKTASNPMEARSNGSIRKKVTSTVGGEKSSGKGPTPDSDIMSQSAGGVTAAKRTPPVVPPKPSSPNKSRISPTSQSDSSIPSSPVLVGHKSSIAERARLVGALEVAESERAPATHFVSSARATLSPVPGRKVFNITSTQEEPEVERKEEVQQESGIVETSIKASSVIKQFETRKISKIKPDEEVFADQPNGGRTSEPTPKEAEKVEKVEKKTTKKKSVDQVSGGTSRRRASGKEATLFKTSSSASLTAKQSAAKTRKESNEQKLVKTTSSVNVTNKNKTRKASKEAETKPTTASRKSSEASVGRKSSDTSSIKRSASNASTISVKSRENTFVKRSSSRQLLPDIDRDLVDAKPLVPTDEDTGAQNDRSIVKTTMVVRLQPGQERKLSGDENKDEHVGEEEGGHVVDGEKELEIEIARSEVEEELVEEAEIENMGDDETVEVETVGDIQSVEGIENDPEEEAPLVEEGILEDTDGGLEDIDDTAAEDDKEEAIESASEEENGEDLTEEKRRASRMEESPPGLLRGSSTTSLKCRQ